VYRETAVEADGPFGETTKQRRRVLREIITGGGTEVTGELWELERKDDQSEELRWARIEAYGIDLPRIPVVCAYAGRSGIFESDPPLRDLAYEQIEHYRVRSDRQKSLTFSSISVPYAIGKEVTDAEGKGKVRWGTDGMMLINDPEAKAGVLESHGYGLSATKEELQEIQARMASLGLQMLVAEPGTKPTTATEHILGKSESDAALVLFARSIERAINEAVELHGMYRGQDEPGEVTVNTDFHDQLIDPALLGKLTEMVAAGLLSLDTLWAVLVKGELLDEAFDAEEERERIRRDGSLGLGEDDGMTDADRELLAKFRAAGIEDEAA
jgi:hypothetical protein